MNLILRYQTVKPICKKIFLLKINEDDIRHLIYQNLSFLKKNLRWLALSAADLTAGRVLYFSESVVLRVLIICFLFSLSWVLDFSSVTIFLKSISPLTMYLVGIMWFRLTYFTKGLTVVRFWIFLAPIFFVTFLGYL